MNQHFFDYARQAWVIGGRYVRCGHTRACTCYGRLHAGERFSVAGEPSIPSIDWGKPGENPPPRPPTKPW